MKKALRRTFPLLWVLLLVSAVLVPAPMYADNDVMGEIQFEGKSHVEKTSGVWVDGQYVGYLNELIRIENKLKNADGETVGLKPGAQVEVTIEAEPEDTVKKSDKAV
jgi:hypothetical protein